MRFVLVMAGLVLLITLEILRVYFIMPFPGSQEDDTLQIAYFIQGNILYFRLLGVAVVSFLAFPFLRNGGPILKITLAVVVGFYAVVFYLFNFRFLADKMFLQPRSVSFLDVSNNNVPARQLIVGVTIGRESKAYPIEIIGYHHQIRDVVGSKSVMITYCTVCRTGRVFSPVINGADESFRLVGMDHYNAMFEDQTTKSWWRQVSGEAVTGPLKGKKLEEIPSAQMTLANWIELHPGTKILQPDSTFSAAYKELEDYDEGKKRGRLEGKDSLSWKDKSWVVGIQIGMEARAYDWNDLQRMRAINDVVGSTPVLILANPDSSSFRAFSRTLGMDTLDFRIQNESDNLLDTRTGSTWDWMGACEGGPLKGKSLDVIQSYQEYWHSWKTFRPQTSRYTPVTHP